MEYLYAGNTMETDKDYRILMADLALNRIKDNIFLKTTIKPGLGKEELTKLISTMESTIMSIKYSYKEAADLADGEMVGTLFNCAKDMYLGNKESIETGMREKPRVNLLWALNIFSGLARRLKNQGLKPTHAIDIVAVKIRNISEGDKLYTTKVVAGPREMTVVTNIEGLVAGDTLRAALLPPAQVGGIWSEAMFLGDEKVDVESGTLLDPAGFDTKEADGILVNELKG